jgi:sporulation protein YlmC with PRC-barrel domain
MCKLVNGVVDLGERFYRREELVGKLVYDSKAVKVGEVVDVGYSKEGRVALVVKLGGGKERIIPFTSISEVGDIVILKPETEGEAAPKPEVERAKECPKCGKENKPSAKFCIKCGHKF